MKTKHIRADLDTAALLMKMALERSAKEGRIISVADTLKEIVDDYKSRQKNGIRLA